MLLILLYTSIEKTTDKFVQLLFRVKSYFKITITSWQ